MVRGLNVPDDPKKIRVVLTPTGGTFEPYPSETLNSNSSSFIFRIPLESECPREIKNARGLCLPLGTYDVRAEITMSGGASPPQVQIAPYDGQLRLVSGVGNEVKITAVSPFVGYPDDRNTFAFRILGQGFSREARDNVLAIDNGKEYRELGPQEIDWLPTEPITKKYDHLYGARGSSGRELVLWGIPRDYQGQGKRSRPGGRQQLRVGTVHLINCVLLDPAHCRGRRSLGDCCFSVCAGPERCSSIPHSRQNV